MPPTRKRTEDAAHDVLAAEEFGVPAPDPTLHHGPITLPDDPTGIAEPHDVLAAEEFAMPAPRQGSSGGGGLAQRAHGSRRSLALGAIALLALVRLVRRRRG